MFHLKLKEELVKKYKGPFACFLPVNTFDASPVPSFKLIFPSSMGTVGSTTIAAGGTMASGASTGSAMSMRSKVGELGFNVVISDSEDSAFDNSSTTAGGPLKNPFDSVLSFCPGDSCST